MIRWEQQASGEWQGLSGELPVATVIKDPDAKREQWVWKIKCYASAGSRTRTTSSSFTTG
jgi:hypothetical protein